MLKSRAKNLPINIPYNTNSQLHPIHIKPKESELSKLAKALRKQFNFLNLEGDCISPKQYSIRDNYLNKQLIEKRSKVVKLPDISIKEKTSRLMSISTRRGNKENIEPLIVTNKGNNRENVYLHKRFVSNLRQREKSRRLLNMEKRNRREVIVRDRLALPDDSNYNQIVTFTKSLKDSVVHTLQPDYPLTSRNEKSDNQEFTLKKKAKVQLKYKAARNISIANSSPITNITILYKKMNVQRTEELVLFPNLNTCKDNIQLAVSDPFLMFNI